MRGLAKRRRQLKYAQSRIDYWRGQRGPTAKARLSLWRRRRRHLKKLILKLSTGSMPPKAKVTLSSVKRWFTRPPIKPTLIVLHDTESPAHSGYNTSAYLSRGNVQADIHVVIDVDGTTYRLVPDGRKAWHVAAYNSRALGIEQIGYATQREWPLPQLQQSARYIAHWSKKYGIPIRDARANLTSGVVTHKSLGRAGGGHHDPGPNYPFSQVLSLARQYAQQ